MAECRNCIQDYGLCGDCYEGSLYKGMNNANRIRNMSDEELAEFLCGVYDEGEGKFINGIVIQNYDEDRIAEWLKSEVNE